MLFLPNERQNPLNMVIAHALINMLAAIREDPEGRTKFRLDHLVQDLDQQWNNPLLTALAIKALIGSGLLTSTPCPCRPDCLNEMIEISESGMKQATALTEQIAVVKQKIEAKWGPIAEVERAVEEGTMSMEEILDHVHGPRQPHNESPQPSDPTETPQLDVDVVVLDLSEPPQPNDLGDLVERLKARMGQSGTTSLNIPKPADPNSN